jgi:hypothetical protein
MTVDEAKLKSAEDAWKRGLYKTKLACAIAKDVDYQLFLARLGGRQSRKHKRPVNKRLTD